MTMDPVDKDNPLQRWRDLKLAKQAEGAEGKIIAKAPGLARQLWSALKESPAAQAAGKTALRGGVGTAAGLGLAAAGNQWITPDLPDEAKRINLELGALTGLGAGIASRPGLGHKVVGAGVMAYPWKDEGLYLAGTYDRGVSQQRQLTAQQLEAAKLQRDTAQVNRDTALSGQAAQAAQSKGISQLGDLAQKTEQIAPYVGGAAALGGAGYLAYKLYQAYQKNYRKTHRQPKPPGARPARITLKNPGTYNLNVIDSMDDPGAVSQPQLKLAGWDRWRTKHASAISHAVKTQGSPEAPPSGPFDKQAAGAAPAPAPAPTPAPAPQAPSWVQANPGYAGAGLGALAGAGLGYFMSDKHKALQNALLMAGVGAGAGGGLGYLYGQNQAQQAHMAALAQNNQALNDAISLNDKINYAQIAHAEKTIRAWNGMTHEQRLQTYGTLELPPEVAHADDVMRFHQLTQQGQNPDNSVMGQEQIAAYKAHRYVPYSELQAAQIARKAIESDDASDHATTSRWARGANYVSNRMPIMRSVASHILRFAPGSWQTTAATDAAQAQMDAYTQQGLSDGFNNTAKFLGAGADLGAMIYGGGLAGEAVGAGAEAAGLGRLASMGGRAGRWIGGAGGLAKGAITQAPFAASTLIRDNTPLVIERPYGRP